MKNIISKILILTLIILLALTLQYKGYCIGEITDAAHNFLHAGQAPENTIDINSVKETSEQVFNMFFIVGIVIAILVGAFLGLNIMIATVEEKAKIKEMLIPYIVGCMIIFSAFTIWKFVVAIGNNIIGDEQYVEPVETQEPEPGPAPVETPEPSQGGERWLERPVAEGLAETIKKFLTFS